ncbi:GloB Zn-dependent hydrolases, including glyoxylases [Candidatus Nanopelagicaceae bacterium]
MLIRSHVAPMFATNCWIIAPEKGSECIIVDPGMTDISAEVEMIVAEEGLKPVAVLLTHGHLDHTFSVKPLADGYGISAYIHSEDRRFIADPAGIHGPQFVDQLSGMHFEEPVKVENLKDGSLLDFLGMKIRAIHAPGHTRGSLMFLLNEETLISGDVLFAGSIGRTDLPTGSASDMRNTLKKKVLPLSDEIRVLPGHGDETTIKYERKTNPYLKELA